MKVSVLALGATIALGVLGTSTFAQDKVTFQATDIQPSALKLRKAKAEGIILEPTPGIELSGFSYVPDQEGPHPAVIVLLSGDGLTPARHSWAEALSDAGFVALVVDSYGARGGSNHMNVHNVNMPDDAYSAYRYLTTRSDVDADQISLLGFSIGGSHLFTVVGAGNPRVPEGFNPKAAVAVYPTCPPMGAATVPMMLLAGDADSLMSLATCESFVAQSQASAHPASLHIYPGATHFFDNPAYAKGGAAEPDPKPMWFKGNHYDADAHADAVVRVLEFLKAPKR